MRSIPIDVLRAFVAVVEARGFTRAAENLGRSQPTVSLQVKRLEELVEAPLFDNAARFALTGVGAVCFDYGKRLLRLHDDMLDEASQRKSPSAALRVGAPSELAARLAARLGQWSGPASAIHVMTGASETLAAAFRQNSLDAAFVIGLQPDPQGTEHWRAPLGWYGVNIASRAKDAPLPLAIPPQDSALQAATIDALRSAERKFEIVCVCEDSAVLAAAASAGLGVTPMIEALAPAGLKPLADKSLPALPPLVLSLLARSPVLANAARSWVADIVGTLESR